MMSLIRISKDIGELLCGEYPLAPFEQLVRVRRLDPFMNRLGQGTKFLFYLLENQCGLSRLSPLLVPSVVTHPELSQNS